MDIFDFICGTVPLIFFLHGHGPRGPWPWAVFLAGGLGGIAAVALFGAKYAGDGGAVSTFLVAAAGGAFLGQVVSLASDLASKRIVGPDRG